MREQSGILEEMGRTGRGVVESLFEKDKIVSEGFVVLKDLLREK